MKKHRIGEGKVIIGIGLTPQLGYYISFDPTDETKDIGQIIKDKLPPSKKATIIEVGNIESLEVLEKQIKILKRKMRAPIVLRYVVKVKDDTNNDDLRGAS